jgi:hypothetical protein
MNAKALLPDAGQAEQAVRQLIEIDDLGHRADIAGCRRAPPALADQHHAEALVLAHAAAHHVDVARLEDAQRQRTAGKQHDVERKQRNRRSRRPAAARRGTRAQFASSFSCRPPKPPLLMTST